MAYYKHAHYHAIDSGSIAKSTFYVDMQLQQDQKTESTSGKNNAEAQSHDMCEDMGQVVLCAQSKSKNQKDKHDKDAEALEQKDPGVSMGQVVGGDTTQPSGEKGGVTMGTEDKVLGVEHMEYMGGRRSSTLTGSKTCLRSQSQTMAAAWKAWYHQHMHLVLTAKLKERTVGRWL